MVLCDRCVVSTGMGAKRLRGSFESAMLGCGSALPSRTTGRVPARLLGWKGLVVVEHGLTCFHD